MKFSPEDHQVTFYYYPIQDACARSMMEICREWRERTAHDLAAIKLSIFFDVRVRKPLLSPAPSTLCLTEILSAASWLRPLPDQPDESYFFPAGSVTISLHKNRIFFEPAHPGGRKAQKRFHRLCLHLMEKLLSEHFGLPCRVRLKRTDRLYIVQFTKPSNHIRRS